MFSLTTSSQALSASSSNSTSSYGLLSMAIEAINYWMTGVNPRLREEVQTLTQSTELQETDWDAYGDHLRRLTGPEGAEFQVNTYTTSNQKTSAIASLADGGFVITWASDGQDGYGYGIYAQRYTSSSSKSGSEFQVNTYTTGSQSSPAIASLADGGFVITWESDGQDGYGNGVYAQRYTSSSSPYGAEFLVNTYKTDYQKTSAIASLADGGFVITWESYGQDGSGDGVYAQCYTSSSSKSGSEFRVNTYTTSNQETSAIAGLANRGFVITWASNGQDGSNLGVYAQHYTSCSSKSGSEFGVNTYTTNTQWYPAIAGLADGGFVITWESYGQDGSGYGVYAQRYTSSSSKSGSEFRVNTYTTSNQKTSAIAGLADGGFVITWESYGQDGSSFGIYAQRYTSSSSPYGLEFQVNTYTPNTQWSPAIAGLADGGFVITWESNGQDGSSLGVYGKRFDSSWIFTPSPTAHPTPHPTFRPTFPPTAHPTVLPTLAPTAHPTVSPTLAPTTPRPTFRPTVLPTVMPSTPTLTPTAFPTRLPSAFPTRRPTLFPTAAPTLSPTKAALQLMTGSVFIANDAYYSRYRSNTALAGLAGGGYVVTWESSPQSSSGYDVYGRRYDDLGQEQGSEFLVNTYTSNNQYYPAVAGLNDGGFVVTWESNGQDGSFYGIYAQRYVSSGEAYGGEFRVNTYTTRDQKGVAIASLADGGFVVTWESDLQDGSSYGIYGQRYDALSRLYNGEFQVNSYTTNSQSSPVIVGLDAGGFVVSWVSSGQDGSSNGIYARCFDELNQALGSDFRVNSYTSGDQQSPAMALLVDGGFMVAWESNGQDGSDYGIYAQRYNAICAKEGSEFAVNSYTTGAQRYPSVAGLDDGGFMISWTDFNSQAGFGSDIYAQRYYVSGVTQGSAFRVNEGAAEYDQIKQVMAQIDNGVVVSWESNRDSSSQNKDIMGKRYATSGNWPSDSSSGSSSSNNVLFLILAIGIPVGALMLGVCLVYLCDNTNKEKKNGREKVDTRDHNDVEMPQVPRPTSTNTSSNFYAKPAAPSQARASTSQKSSNAVNDLCREYARGAANEAGAETAEAAINAARNFFGL
jgi:hypothetical protein